MPKTPTKTIGVTLDARLADRLRAEADARMISPSLIANKAIAAFLNTLPPIDPTLTEES